jgi:hypothetical protein
MTHAQTLTPEDWKRIVKLPKCSCGSGYRCAKCKRAWVGCAKFCGRWTPIICTECGGTGHKGGK